MKKILVALFVILAATVMVFGMAGAKVSGECYNCHTMHNSQDGAPVALTDAAWESGGVLNGTTDSSPNAYLLVADCIGCHSSATSQTIVTAGTSDIPIVYNHVEPTSPLAGGNFYWVAEGDDTAGHNVYGISSQDINITVSESAPGHDGVSCGGPGSCHSTLAAPPDDGAGPGSTGNWNRGGCQGCHVFTYHHEDNGVYRFLKGHGGGLLPSDIDADNRDDISANPDYVEGVEDDDWEQETSTRHNWYLGTSAEYYNDGFTDGLLVRHTITAYCSGCHWGFHGPKGVDVTNPELGMGSGSPWFRHPVDIALPTTGEYAAYDPTTDYSVETPVAWETLPADTSGTGADGPIVMCLSCHRSHGSDQPDILRFDYDTMLAGMGGSGGCFNCHSAKN